MKQNISNSEMAHEANLHPLDSRLIQRRAASHVSSFIEHDSYLFSTDFLQDSLQVQLKHSLMEAALVFWQHLSASMFSLMLH